MARLLIKGEWFNQLASESLYEDEYEKILESHSNVLFPNYHFIPFKIEVDSEYGVRKPDYALISINYHHWYVVEAELAHHPFESHVKPQVQVFSNGNYNTGHADFLLKKKPDLNCDRLISMIKGDHPRTLVIVNSASVLNSRTNDWAVALKQFDCSVMILEIFKSERNHFVFRVNGEQPSQEVHMMSKCTSEQVSRLLKVHSPGILRFKVGERVQIAYAGGFVEMGRMDLKDSVYLTYSKPLGLKPKTLYYLVEGVDGQLSLIKND